MTIESAIEAYLVCRKNKRGTISALDFEINYEEKLLELVEAIQNRTYYPGTSICFIVTRPRYREVFAANFADRIIHHWIAIRLEPLLEQTFTDRTFNCRVGKGQLYGTNQMKEDIFNCSEGYTRDCHIMQLDLKGFFMSINRKLMAKIVDDFILEKYTGDDIDTLRFLCKTVITHAPEHDCIRHSEPELWEYLPANKSLFTNGEGLGIAIGNLFAQHFANLLLNSLDWFIIEGLGFPYYGRYVDDFYLIHHDKEKLLSAVQPIREHLSSLDLSLNERKFYFQHYAKGAKFLGAVIKPYRSYIGSRTLNNFEGAIRNLNQSTTINQIQHSVASINSYLGLLRQHSEYSNRKKYLQQIEPHAFKYVYIQGSYEVLSLKNEYKCIA